jgi:hypothetical protein
MELGTVISLVGVAVAIILQTVLLVAFITRLAVRLDYTEKALLAMSDIKYEPRLTKVEILLELIQTQQDEQIKRLDHIATKVGAKGPDEYENPHNKRSPRT